MRFLAALLSSFGLQYVQVRVMQDVGQKTMYDMRKEIFAHLQRLPMSFYDRSPVGRLVTRVTTDVDALNDLFASGVVAMLNDVFAAVLSWSSCCRMNWRLALATLRRAALYLAAYLDLPQPGARREPANSNGDRAHQRVPAGTHQRHAVVQLFNRERKARAQFAELNRDAHGSVQGRDLRLRAVLSGRGIFQHGGDRVGVLVWRRARDCAGRSMSA